MHIWNINFVQLQTEMQRMMIEQMKQQQDFPEKRERIRHDQTAERIPKLEMASLKIGQDFVSLSNALYALTKTYLEWKK